MTVVARGSTISTSYSTGTVGWSAGEVMLTDATSEGIVVISRRLNTPTQE